MQPGYPGSGQDPYGQQQPYVDPYSQPQYSPQQPQPPQQQSQEDKPQEEQPPPPPQYQDPYAQPTSGASYPPPAPGYPGTTPYPTAGYGAPMGVPPQQNNTLGVLAMVFGILSIPLACCPFLGFIVGVAGIVLGVLGMKKAGAGEASNRGQALAGVICGAVGIVVSITWLIVSLALHIGSNLPTTT